MSSKACSTDSATIFFDIFVTNIDCLIELDDFLMTGFHVACEDAEDPLAIDLELDADAWHAFGRRLKFEFEGTERPVVTGHFAFAWSTWIFIDFWLSTAVVKSSPALVGWWCCGG